MLAQLLLLLACTMLGAWLQRRPSGDVVRARLWAANYVLLIPLAATYAFLSLQLDRELVTVVACGVGAWWLTVLAAGAVAYASTRERELRGALWLVGAFPNTGFIGFPLANLAFGHDGLRLAIVYDQVSLVVPAIVVSTLIARLHAAPDQHAATPPRSLLREALVSPPLWTVVALLLVRATVLPDPLHVELLGSVVGHVVGPVGFLLLGLSLPLGGFVHDGHEVAATTCAVLVRIALAPGLVWLVARTAGVDAPDALYLIAAMPTAFHALVISRINRLEVSVVRLGVLASSLVVVAATVSWMVAR